MLRIAVALCLTGCSVITVNGPGSSGAPMNRPSCTESYALPAVDAVIAAATATGALYFSSKGEDVGVLVESAVAVGFGINALVGVARVKSCKRAITTFESTAAHQGVYTPAPAMPAPSP